MNDDTKTEPLPPPEVYFKRPRTLARLGKGTETIEGCAKRLAVERDTANVRIEELEGALRETEVATQPVLAALNDVLSNTHNVHLGRRVQTIADICRRTLAQTPKSK